MNRKRDNGIGYGCVLVEGVGSVGQHVGVVCRHDAIPYRIKNITVCVCSHGGADYFGTQVVLEDIWGWNGFRKRVEPRSASTDGVIGVVEGRDEITVEAVGDGSDEVAVEFIAACPGVAGGGEHARDERSTWKIGIRECICLTRRHEGAKLGEAPVGVVAVFHGIGVAEAEAS